MSDGPVAAPPPDAGAGVRARVAGGRTRVVGAATGLAGVALAATTTVWPTKIFALRMPEVGDFTRGYEQWLWAWGRDVVHYTSNGLEFGDTAGPVPVPRLVLLVVVLLLATAGLVGCLVRPGQAGLLAAAAGTALALGTVGASLVDRLSFDDRTIGLQPGLVAVTTTAGWLELAAALLFVTSLSVLVVPVLLPGPSNELARRAAALLERVRAPRVVAEPGPAARAGTTRTPAVGFTDASDADDAARHA